MILVACEFSGRVREALRDNGVDAVSCDIEASDIEGHHYQGDVFEAIKALKPSAVIAFPPCTYPASSGIHWNTRRPERARETDKAIEFVKRLWDSAPVVAIENPVGVLSTRWIPPTQRIEPWQFGHGETKKTCLWLKGLPTLKPTHIVEGRAARILAMSPSNERKRQRSLTYQGIADAMGDQWGSILRAIDRK